MSHLSLSRADAVRLLRACDRECYPSGWQPAEWLRVLGRRGWVVVTGRDGPDGPVAGYLVAEAVRDGSGEYWDVVRCGVLPELRGLGLCRELLTSLGGGEVRAVLREGNLPGLLAAKALGFRAVGLRRGWAADGSDGVDLRRPAACVGGE